MLSRGLRLTFVVGIAMVLFALGLHTVLKYYNAPSDVEYSLISTFAATFASTILTFFIGALLYDYQAERNEAKRDEQLRRLLAAELSEIVEGLDPANATKVRLSDGSATEAVITHLQPTVTEEAVRGGFLDPPRVEGALRLARNARLQREGLLSVVDPVTGDDRRAGARRVHTPRDRGDGGNATPDRG